MSASGEGMGWEAPPTSGKAALWWTGSQPHHQPPRTSAALETVLVTRSTPFPLREDPLDRQIHLRLIFGFCDKKGTCWVFLPYTLFWLHICL